MDANLGGKDRMAAAASVCQTYQDVYSNVTEKKTSMNPYNKARIPARPLRGVAPYVHFSPRHKPQLQASLQGSPLGLGGHQVADILQDQLATCHAMSLARNLKDGMHLQRDILLLFYSSRSTHSFQRAALN